MRDQDGADQPTAGHEAGKVAGSAAAVVAAGATVAGCSGGGSGGGGGPVFADDFPTTPEAPTAAPTKATAAQFLMQSTFGPTEADINNLQQIGYDAWLNEQFEASVSDHNANIPGGQPDPNQRVYAWFKLAVEGEDQLRGRVAFALSQILVVSEVDLSGSERTRGLTRYYDILSRNAFGNYRQLLEEISLHPMMGEYLSSIRNEKADATRNIRPDENFARELMQLFSIGLVQLNLDGTERRDGSGNPIPTYSQDQIEGFAAVFTGWTYAGTTNWNQPNTNDRLSQMIPFEAFHELGAKTVLDNLFIPAGSDTRRDLEIALDTVFAHPNVAPFISKQLIQRLVTSNPTPAYVQRVATVFNNDGNGVKGNLKAVVRAILFDTEARNGGSPNSFGKLKEPILKLTHLWRAFRAQAANTAFVYSAPERDFGQAPLRAPTVFNFYRPDYAQPGTIENGNMVSPEFQILTESFAILTANRFERQIFNMYQGASGRDGDDILLNIDIERQLGDDAPALVDRLNDLLLAGRMEGATRTILINYLTSIDFGTDGTNRIIEAIYLVATSPEFAVQR